MNKKFIPAFVMLLLCLLFFGSASAVTGIESFQPVLASFGDTSIFGGAVALAGMGNIQLVTKQIEGIENSIKTFQEKAEKEIQANGKASEETKKSLDKLGEQQLEMANRMLALEQQGAGGGGDAGGVKSMGTQFTDSKNYVAFQEGNAQKARFDIENNSLTGSDATVAPDRQPGIVGGAMQPLALEDIFPRLPTTSNAIEYVRENVFVNNAAEVAEAGAKPETDLGFELKSMPVSTVAHWVKISRQLADDAPALGAYINGRMIYGVNKRVDSQLAVGNGTAPNLSGILNAGNFASHVYTAANLGGTLAKLVLIRKLIADCWIAGYPADTILLNPIDWAQIEIDVLTTLANVVRIGVNSLGQQTLFNVPIVQAIGITADTVTVASLQQACTLYDRQSVTVELSESDGDNFTTNMITIRAERRLALTVERPAAIISGDLTPA